MSRSKNLRTAPRNPDRSRRPLVQHGIDYAAILAATSTKGAAAAEYLRTELPNAWLDAYLLMTPRPANVLVCTHGSFDYIYDYYSALDVAGVAACDDSREARLVAAIGFATPNLLRRDDGRLRGWVGPTGRVFGDGWDKGHFIGHALGGAVDGLEMNVFLHRRSVNRGGYRQMEKY